MVDAKRKSYTRELKLSVVKWHHQNGISRAGTARKFCIARKQIRTWLNREEKLQQQKSLSSAYIRDFTV